jgi:hypothetical protein
MIAGDWHRRARLPAILAGLVDLQGIRVPAGGAHPTGGIEASVDHGGGERAAGRGEGRSGAPAVGPGIVLEHAGEHGPLPLRVAAHDVEPTSDRDGRGVMDRHRQRGSPLPAVRSRVVRLDLVAALAEPADHVEAPAELRPGDLGAARQERRGPRPGPRPPPAPRGGDHDDQEGDGTEELDTRHPTSAGSAESTRQAGAGVRPGNHSSRNLRYGPSPAWSHSTRAAPKPVLSSFPRGRQRPFSRGAGLPSTAYFGVCSPRSSLSETPPPVRPRSSCSRFVCRPRSDGVPRESLDTPEILPKEAPRQVALGQ